MLNILRSLCVCPLCCVQMGDRGVAELQQTMWKDRIANSIAQLHSAIIRQHLALHPQQTLQRQPSRDPQTLQPTRLPYPVESWTVVTGMKAKLESKHRPMENHVLGFFFFFK